MSKAVKPSKKMASKKTKDQGSFEDSLKSLQDTVEQIQSGVLSLNQSIEKFTAAKELAKNLQAMLESAEKKVKS